jgi:hypothetical protein
MEQWLSANLCSHVKYGFQQEKKDWLQRRTTARFFLLGSNRRPPKMQANINGRKSMSKQESLKVVFLLTFLSLNCDSSLALVGLMFAEKQKTWKKTSFVRIKFVVI